jgi:hypothetical protein
MRGSAYNAVFAAGMAFLEIRRTDQGGIQPAAGHSHDLVAVVSKGLSGYHVDRAEFAGA